MSDGYAGDDASAAARAQQQQQEQQKQLHAACARGDVAAVAALLEVVEGAVVDARDEAGKAALYVAAERGDERVLQLLVNFGADPRARTMKGKTALHAAAARGGVDALRFLLEHGLDADVRDNRGRSVFHAAALVGNIATLGFLMNRGVDVNAVAKDGLGALHFAAIKSQAKAVEFLLEDGLVIGALDYAGRSVLHAAAHVGDVDTLRVLIEHGVDLGAIAYNGRTPLHEAALAGKADAVALLLEQGLYISALDQFGGTVMHNAALGGDVRIMQLLMERGADIHAITMQEATPLHCAARSNRLEAVKFLLEQGAAIDAVDKNGESVLHFAAVTGNVHIMQLFIEHGASIHAVAKNGWTVLHTAAQNGRHDAVAFLVDHGLPVDSYTKNRESVFHLAALGGDVTTMRFLIDQDADIDWLTKDCTSALHYAVRGGKLDAVKLLVELGADVDAVNENGDSVIHFAAQGGNVQIMQILIQHGADFGSYVNLDGQTALHLAVRAGNFPMIKFMLDQGFELDTANEAGVSALELAASGGSASIIQLLVDRGAAVTSATKNGWTPLHTASTSGHVEAVKLLVQLGNPVDGVDENGATAFNCASVAGNVGIMQLLMKYGADPHASSESGRTALHLAARTGKLQAVKFLLDLGLPINGVDGDGASALHFAAWEGHTSVMEYLLERGADVQAVMKDGKNALYCAATSGHAGAVRLLVDRGLEIESSELADESALEGAALKGDFRTMRYLIESGADPDMILEDGGTLLHLSSRSGEIQAVKYLLHLGCDVNTATTNGIYPLHVAAQAGFVDIVRALVDHGADIRATAKDGRTVLHSGAFGGDVDMVKYLLGLGLAIEATGNDGSTALHAAAVKGNVEMIQLLIDSGADTSAITKNGWSALHICAKNGSDNAAQVLLEHGVDADRLDKWHGTALHVAANNGHFRVMEVLVEYGANSNVQMNDHRNLLHHAVQARDPAVLKYALELGVDINVHAHIRGRMRTPLCCVFLWRDSTIAYEKALALCSFGASLSDEDRLEALTRAENVPVASINNDASKSPSEPSLWRDGLCVCVDHWTQEHAAGAMTLTNIPIEVVNRGEASVKTYLADVARSTYDDRLHRCKICVVGPSEWGKTSLVQSLRANKTFLTKLKDRTVGIELTTWLLNTIANNSPVRTEITFWDFAGQDVYQAAHTLFFSQRTLFVLVVDLEKYWKELEDATGKSDRVSEAQMDRFVSAKIFRWVRSIFAHQPDAQFVVVGTKMNKLEDARVVADVWDDLRDRLDHWKAVFAKGLDSELLPAGASAKDIRYLQGRLSKLASSEWLVSNLLEVDSITQVRDAVQNTITSSELGFPMWKTYTQVLQSVVKRREEAKNESNPRERIEKSIIRFSNLRRQLLREIDELDRDACEQIMRTLNDLGDVLWYEHEGAGVLKDYIILDPMLVIEVVREVIRHDFSSHNEGCSPQDGRITHSLLSTFPLWKDMDVELMHAFKALLQHFQLAYPVDADVMLPESDIIVPAYWNADSAVTSDTASNTRSLGPQKSVCDVFSAHRWCWEYEIPSELSETIFVQFAVQSHSSYLPRTVRGFCVEVACDEFAASIALIQENSARDVIRIEVSGVSADLGWNNMRFYLMKMEKVLEEYRGDVVWRYIAYRRSESASETRHPVGSLVKAIEDAIARGKGTESVRPTIPWMPPSMDWFMRKSWKDVAILQQLQVNRLVEEKLEALRKLAIAGDTPRQFPALWSLGYIPEAQKAVLRMSSDLSGRCYHVPIEIETGSPLLARHASIFKAGVSLFATVVGNAVSLPLVQTVADAAKSALESKADNAVRVHNLIDKLDISPSQGFDAHTNSKLSPRASMVLLRDLLQAYDDSVDALEISEISNLECAVTSSGEYVWAHAHEIAAMDGKLVRCSAPPSSWGALDVKDESPSLEEPSREEPPACVKEVSSPAASIPVKTSPPKGFKFSISVDKVVGLSDWDWHKTYCTWQLYYSNKPLTPLAVDVTPTNGDSSQPPSWRAMRVSIDAVASVEMLRECRLAVQVKRRSRIGWTKHIGEGQVWLRDFLDEEAEPNFSCEPVRVPLDVTAADRAVIIDITAEN